MRILIIHHHSLPSKKSSVTGSGIRAYHLGSGLQSAGLQVQFLCKEHWHEHWNEAITHTISNFAPDSIICTQLEDACILPETNCPVVIDLYAPRLLEVAFATDQQFTASNILVALGRGDAFMVSNQRQTWHWMGIFALAGIDIRTDPSLITPLACELHEKTPKDKLILVGGGRQWPWQSPIPTLKKVLDFLDNQNNGTVHWFTGPNEQFQLAHPRLQIQPWTDRITYRNHLSKCSIALDIDQPSPERSLAMGFRHMEYLGCGLPIICTSNSALSSTIPEACLVGTDVTSLLKKAINKKWQTKASKAAVAFAQQNTPPKIVSNLVSWIQQPTSNSIKNSSLIHVAKAIIENEQCKQDLKDQQTKIISLQREIQSKSELIASLNLQIQEYSGTVHRLARSIDEVSAFKQNTAQVLGNEIHAHRDAAQNLEEENASLRIDNAKKTAELQAMDLLRARLENDIHNLQVQLQQQRKRFWS
jgi:hypothetical protein